MKKNYVYLFIIMFLLFGFKTNVIAENYADTIKSKNPKLYNALLENTMSIDMDGNGVLSNSEIKNFAGNLILSNKNLDSIEGLQYFQSVTDLWLDRNNLTDVSQLFKMKKLNYVSLEANNLNVTYKRDHSYLKKILDLKKQVEGVSYSNQTVDYDASKITKDSRKYKVLYVVVKDIDAKVKLFDGNTVKVKYSMNDDDITLIKEWARLFEQYVEKMTDYKIDIDLDIYVTKNIFTKFNENSHGTSSEGKDDWAIFGPDIPEVADIIEDYDTSIVMAYLDKNIHTYGGLGGYDGNIKRGVATIAYESLIDGLIVNHIPLKDEIADVKKDKSLNGYLDIHIHEFTHTIESYSQALGYETWEFHNSLNWDHYPDTKIGKSDYFDTQALYLLGESNPIKKTEKGIRDEVWSNPPTKNFTTLSSPGKSSLSAKEDGKTITLKWTDVKNVTNYKLLKSTSKNGVYEIIYIGNNTSFIDKNVVEGTNYYYKVVAINSKGIASARGDASNIVSIKIPIKKVEKAPKVTITGNNNSLILTWKKVDNAKKYNILRSTEKNGKYKTIAKNITKLKYTDKSLEYGTKYYYKVVAINDINSKTSSIVSKKVIPNTVENLNGEPGNKKIKLRWDKVSGNGYEIYSSTDNKKYTKIATIENKSTLTYTIKKLKDNKKYYYKVRAYKTIKGKKIYGDYSKILEIKTTPKAPANLKGKRKSKKVTLSWEKSKGAVSYIVYRSNKKDGKYTKIGTTKELSFVDNDAKSTYYYKVRAYITVNNKNYYSPYSDIIKK